MTVGESEDVITRPLFDNVDWDRVDIIQMEADLEGELSRIEAENVAALVDSGSRVDHFLPTLRHAEGEVGALETLLSDYMGRLSVMGSEIHEIEKVNRSLTQRQLNQQRLLDTLNDLFASVNLSQMHVQTLEAFCDHNGMFDHVYRRGLASMMK
jgi:hypothetical protein